MKPFLTICFALSLLALPLLITGCEKKSDKKLPYEHSVDKVKTVPNIPATPVSQNLTKTGHTPLPHPSGGKHFNLGDQKGIIHPVSVENDQLLFKDISQPVVILNFFSTWSLPSRAEAPYLADLQKKYPKQVFVMGILLHPDDHLQELEKFIGENQIDYFISSSSENDRFTRQILEKLHMPDILPIPLTVIYHDGHYYRHYEGAVPIEMLEHDIKTILE